MKYNVVVRLESLYQKTTVMRPHDQKITEGRIFFTILDRVKKIALDKSKAK